MRDPFIAASPSLLSAAAYQQAVVEWNDTRTAYPRDATLGSLFEAQVASTPDAAAVTYGEPGSEPLTYRQLDDGADRLARRLAGLGVVAGSRVGLCVERSTAMVVALVAIVKSGAAYVPLDPSYPSARLAFMVADAGLAALVTTRRLLPMVPTGELPVLLLDDGDAAAAPIAGDHPGRAVAGDGGPRWWAEPNALAYLMYTSGSTGRPKAIGVPHRAIVRLVRNTNYLKVTPADRVAQGASISFDAATFEIWGALLHGACLVGIARSAMQVVDDLAAALAAGRVTILFLTTALFNQVAHQAAPTLARLRCVLFGGEAADAGAVRRVAAEGAPRRLVHVYGPTESTTFSTFFVVGGLAAGGTSVPIGRAVANTCQYVLDRDLLPVPVGATGELLLGGDGLAWGYPNLPALTAERFVPDPFAARRGEPGARLYRTGDMVRLGADGNVDFVGREDFQVKVRGFRIELGEVESALLAHPAVAEAAVVAVPDAAQGRRLAAWYVPATAGAATAAELRAFLRRLLPDHMVPQTLAALPALPLTPNGKVDRQELARHLEPEPLGAAAPLTPMEEVVAAAWAAALGRQRFGPHDDFFESGGNSLSAGQVVSRLRQALGLELAVASLFEQPTVAGLARLAEAALAGRAPGEADPAAPPPLAPADRTAALPLSFAQERLWFLAQLAPDNPFYNVAAACELEGPLDAAAFAAALDGAVRRHEALRTVFVAAAGVPRQVVLPHLRVGLPLVDLSGLTAAARQRQGERLAEQAALAPFDLARAPLLRAMLLRGGAERHRLLLTLHHIVCDGWSMAVLVGDLAALYRAARTGTPDPLPALAVQYADFAVWQRGWLQDGPAPAQLLGSWRRALAGAPAMLELPTDRPRPPAQSFRGGSRRVAWPATLARYVATGARQRTATTFMVLLAAFQALLARLSGQRDVVVGTPFAGRTRVELEGLVGCLVNSLPLRAVLDGDAGFEQLLEQVRTSALAAYAHQDLPFERLVEELAPERNLSHSPVFQVMFALQNVPHPAVAFDDLALCALEFPERSAKYDLALLLEESPAGLHGALVYSSDLFDAATAERVAGHYAVLLAAALAEPRKPLANLHLLSAAERAQLVAEWNDTAVACPLWPLVHELFAGHARRRPEALAVASPSRRMTYGELAGRAGVLARRLRRLGVGPEVRVGLCTERTPERVVGIVAVLAAGGAYVSLDPLYPRERLAFLLDDAQVPVLLTEQAYLDRLPETDARVLCLDRPEDCGGDWTGEDLGLLTGAAPPGEVGPDNLAYVVYTSGSTGRPKGVEIPHAGLTNLVRWHQRLYDVGPEDRGTQIASPAFDASIWELWPYLAAGASVHIPDAETRLSSAGMVDWWQRQQITLAYLMTPLAEGVLDEPPAPPGSLAVRALIIGGDRLHRGPDPRAGFRLMNHYGPAEYSVACTVAAVPPQGPGLRITIGRPIDNTSIYLLDTHFAPVPVGVPGELYVAGLGLARGYLRRPDLTAQRFVPDPLSREPGARMYRTGDLVRTLPDGDLDFLGRLDHQVKIRGFRIELGEIEALLEQQPGVREAVALAREDTPGATRLVAYVVPHATVEGEAAARRADDLRAALRLRLPEYMVPAAIVSLDALPLTANGKVDRRALPAPQLERRGGEIPAPPHNPTEELVATVWSEVLRCEQIGAHDNFFELGGNSLSATRVVARLRDALGASLPVAVLFEQPTVAGLAQAASAALAAASDGDGDEGEPAGAEPPLVPAARTGPLPLSFSQERIWFLAQLVPDNPFYNVPALFDLAGPLDAAGLGAALDAIVRRHESLRTGCVVEQSLPWQVIAPHRRAALPLADLSGLPAGARARQSAALAESAAATPFDLTRGPLLRGLLLRLAPRAHRLVLTLHHIACDAWSLAVLVGELAALYRAVRTGLPDPLPPLAVQYADFAVWQRRWLQGPALARQLAYWRQALAAAPALLELPADRPRPPVQSFRGGSRSVAWPPAPSHAVAAWARQRTATPFMVLLAAFQALLARLSGQRDLVVGTPLAGRTRVELEGLIGCFLNSLPLRAVLDGEAGFERLLEQVRASALAAYAHQDLPFEKLVEELAPERNLSHSPVFQVMFALQNVPHPAAAMGDVELREHPLAERIAQYDLALLLEESPAGLRGALVYSSDLFDAATAERVAGHYAVLVGAALAEPRKPLANLHLLSAAERAQLVAEWNDTAVACPLRPLVHELFAGHARRRPEALAVASPSRRMTYGELAGRAGVLARRLRRLGVGPEVRVGLCTERTPERVVGIVAVLAAGGAYVSLDPLYPRERLAFLLDDAQVPVLLTEQAYLDRLPETDARVLCLDRPDDCGGDWTGEDQDLLTGAAPPGEVGPDNLAYVVYTSGSTGRPKGVEIPHAGLTNLVRWHQRLYDVGPEDRGTQIASPAFDASIWELWPYLAAGASVHIPDAETRLSSAGMVDWWQRQQITLAYLMTPLAEGVLDEPPAPPGSLAVRALIIGGDRLHRGPDPRAGFRLMNHYGPAEYSVACTVAAVPPQGPGLRITIGRPIDNTSIYLLDTHFAPVPVGVPGELYVAGLGLARGYLRRPDLTAQRFVPDPLSREPGARMYRTGDLVRTLPDGDLDFLGRLDHQVKIRGFRIELSEVEEALAQAPGVRAAAALAREDAPGARRLVAYVVPPAELAPEADQAAWLDGVRHHLRQQLPDYMMPSVLLALPALPLTANGKLDRGALPAPALERRGGDQGYLAPRTSAEIAVAAVWAELLGVPRIGVLDDFFDQGGHSLMATRVVSRLREALQVELPLLVLFEARTVEALAAAIEERQIEGVARAAGGELEQLLDEMDGLSDQQVEQQLAPAALAGEGRR